jgi:hypothetical protein
MSVQPVVTSRKLPFNCLCSNKCLRLKIDKKKRQTLASDGTEKYLQGIAMRKDIAGS